MIATVETITPEVAREYLKFNTANRPLNQGLVEYYARLMKEGKWRLNGEGIQFIKGGALGNGQHRLSAIIKANIPVQILVIRDADSDSFPTYDQGRMRSAKDIFSIYGVPGGGALSSIVKRYHYICSNDGGVLLNHTITNGGLAHTGKSKNKSLSNKELYDLYDLHQSLFQEIVNVANSCYKKSRLLSKTDIGGIMAYLILNKHHDKEFVFGFFTMLCDLQSNSNITINTLREKLYRDNIGMKKMTSLYRSQMVVKAWNAYVTNKELKSLVWNEAKEGKLQFI